MPAQPWIGIYYYISSTHGGWLCIPCESQSQYSQLLGFLLRLLHFTVARRFIKFPRLSSLALCQETRERDREKKRILYSPPSDDDECNNNSVATLANFLSFRRHSHQCTLLLFTILACPVLLSDTHNALYYAMISILLLPWMELNWRTEEEDRRWIFPSWSHAHSSPWRHRCTHL